MVVTGSFGQVARALVESAGRLGVDIVGIGRPALDLERPSGIPSALAGARPDIVVNTAAYTAVDRAESEPARAHAVNAVGAGAVAAAARLLDVPVIQLSTDYVFDGTKGEPYREDDPVGPACAYGASKLEGERAVAAANPDHVILRTAWVYAPYGANFVRTMLRLAESRAEIRVVADQCGCPTYAPDIAAAIVGVARNLLARRDDPVRRGIFHMAGGGETSWAAFAEAIFAGASRRGWRTAKIVPIATADYPTPARRPANSRLDCAKLARVHGVTLPSWRLSLDACLDHMDRSPAAGRAASGGA